MRMGPQKFQPVKAPSLIRPMMQIQELLEKPKSDE